MFGASDVDDESKEGQEHDVQRDTKDSKNLVLIFVVSGILILLVYAVGEAGSTTPWRSFARLFAGLMLVGAAGFAPGGLAGFLFGIPRSLQARGSQARVDTGDARVGGSTTAQDKPRGEPTYGSNTNLEEISDWLTKIIVGIGLVNLKNVRGYLRATAAYFVNVNLSMCSQGCAPIPDSAVLSIFIYFSICGFFFAYLLTRLALPAAFSRAERAVIDQVDQVRRESKAVIEEVKEVKKESIKIGDSLKAYQLSLQAADFIRKADEMPAESRTEAKALLDRALRTAERATTVDPNYALAYVTKGRALKRLSSLEGDRSLLTQALDAVEKAKELDQDSDSALYNAACYNSLLMQDVDGILNDLKKAISINSALSSVALKDSDLDWVRTNYSERFMKAVN